MVQGKVISLKRVEDIIAKLEKEPTQKSIAHFIKIFRICVSQNDDENTDEIKETKNEQDFIIEDGSVYDKVVNFALQRFPYLLKRLLRLEENQILESVNSRKLDIVLKVYLLNIVKMAENVHDEDMLTFMLTFYPILTDFMHPLKKLFMRFLKYMIELWATNNNLKLKLRAFIIIRRVCKHTKSDEVDKIFRRVYVAYFENVRHVSWRTYESVVFMINCFSELMTENKDASYYIGFSYLRQIAVLLKANMDKKDDEKKVFNWQVVNSLRLWTQTISRSSAPDELGQLIYPLVELIMGVNQFSNSQDYLPIKFHLILCLNSLAEKTNTYVPTLKLIKDVLNSGEFRKKKIQSTKKPYDFTISLKIDNKYKNTTVLWNEIFKVSLDLSAEYLAIYSRDIGFPELSYNYIKYLKKLQESVKFIIYKMQIKELLKAINANVDLVLQKRKGINFAPKNIESDQLFSETSFKDVKETPLEQLRNKIVTERETRIKQRILAEKDQIYEEDDEPASEGEGEDASENGSESGDNKDMDIADASDSDAFDPENYKDSDEEDEKEEDEDEYDIDNMDYEGDPDDLPDFDLIDENNDNGANDDENPLSEDDFDGEESGNEEDNEEEEEDDQEDEGNTGKGNKNQNQQSSNTFSKFNKKNKPIAKNKNRHSSFQKGKGKKNTSSQKSKSNGKKKGGNNNNKSKKNNNRRRK